MRILLTPHVLERCLDRDLTREVVEKVIEDPHASGSAEGGRRYSCAPFLLGTKHTWVTVVYERTPSQIVAVTAYRGLPRSNVRIPATPTGAAP